MNTRLFVLWLTLLKKSCFKHERFLFFFFELFSPFSLGLTSDVSKGLVGSQSEMCALSSLWPWHLFLNIFSRVITLILTKRIGRISALSHFCTDLSVFGPYWQDPRGHSPSTALALSRQDIITDNNSFSSVYFLQARRHLCLNTSSTNKLAVII